MNAHFVDACAERVAQLRPAARCEAAPPNEPPCERRSKYKKLVATSDKSDATFVEECANLIVARQNELRYNGYAVTSSIVSSNATQTMQLVLIAIFP